MSWLNSIIILKNKFGLSVGAPRFEPFFAEDGVVLLGKAWPHHDQLPRRTPEPARR